MMRFQSPVANPAALREASSQCSWAHAFFESRFTSTALFPPLSTALRWQAIAMAAGPRCAGQPRALELGEAEGQGCVKV